MRSRLELKGAKELERALGELGEDMANAAGRAAVRTAARELRTELEQTAPYAPGTRVRGGKNYGHLRDNVRHRREKERKPYTIRYIVHFGRAYWAYYREVGTSRQPARPWAVPTFQRMQAQLLRTMLVALGKRMAATSKRLARKQGAARSQIGHNGGPALED